jgi:hypothetical protein
MTEEHTGISTKEFSRLTYEHLNSYIKLANQKASILLTAQLAYLAISANALNKGLIMENKQIQIISVVTALTSAGAAYFAARTVYPDTPDTTQGLLLWESILENRAEEYQQIILENDPDDFLIELLDENYQLARVADTKYNHLRNSLRLTGVMVLLSLFLGAYVLYGL